MNTKEVIAKAIEVVTFLFAGFGFFLSNIAPPENDQTPFAVGFASFLTLVILLLISVLLAKKRTARYRKLWLRVSLGFILLTSILGLAYKYSLMRYTFGFPPDAPYSTYYAGLEVLPGPAERKASKNLSNAQLLDEYGGPQNINRVWPEESRDKAILLTLVLYLGFVLCIATSIFSLTEAFLVGTEKASGSSRRAGNSRPVSREQTR